MAFWLRAGYPDWVVDQDGDAVVSAGVGFTGDTSDNEETAVVQPVRAVGLVAQCRLGSGEGFRDGVEVRATFAGCELESKVRPSELAGALGS